VVVMEELGVVVVGLVVVVVLVVVLVMVKVEGRHKVQHDVIRCQNLIVEKRIFVY
jgi:hypothetical protein